MAQTKAEKRIADFCAWLHKIVENHGLYLWGGQGEKVEKNGRVDLKKIAIMEQTETTAQKVAEKIIDMYLAGFSLAKARFFDCSGLGAYYFLEKGFIKSDTTADGFYRMCKEHPAFDQLKPGDMVFKAKSSAGKWGHIGYVSGYTASGELEVTEARGRAYGVVSRPISTGEWTGTGRPEFWSK